MSFWSHFKRKVVEFDETFMSTSKWYIFLLLQQCFKANP